MRFETSIDIAAPQQRVWDVVSDIERWPERVETVETVEPLTPRPFGKGSRVRLKQPKLPEAIWDITVWDAPSRFEWIQKTTGMSLVASHIVDAVAEGGSRLTLTIEMRGLLAPVMGRLSSDLTNRYMRREAEGMKRAAESA
jgi:uncharacterized membrane protein